MTRNLFILSK